METSLSVECTTAGEVIDALGGTKKVAELLKISQPSVSAWRVDGFPQGRHYQVSEICKRRRIRVNRALVFST